MMIDKLNINTYSQNIETLKTNNQQSIQEAKNTQNETLKINQDKVEISQKRDFQQISEIDKIRENMKAEDMKEKIKTQIEAQPFQAIYSQGNNITASKVANLL